MKTISVINGALGFVFIFFGIEFYPDIEWFSLVIGILYLSLFFLWFAASIDAQREYPGYQPRKLPCDHESLPPTGGSGVPNKILDSGLRRNDKGSET